ncbi:MAG: ATPase P [Desulfobulbaceae bacterium]|nr:MAG: ATPase P [Desulfobulbaceae bacterium]
MLTIAVPGGQTLLIAHLVLDYNGTIALDGRLIEGVAERLARLAPDLQIHILTADTHGTAARETEGLPCLLAVIPPNNQDLAKLDYIEHIGPQRVAAIGNGRNDCLMLERAVLSIAIVGEEGASGRALAAADLVSTDIAGALDLLLSPKRLQATLRN